SRDVSERLVRVERPPRVTAEFKNSPLLEVIDVLAGKAGANVVIAPDVDAKTRISMRFQDVPCSDALDALVKTAGYAVVEEPSEKGNSVGSAVVFLPTEHGGPDFLGGGKRGSTPFVGPISTIRRSRLPFGIGADAVGSDAFWATDFGITATLRLFQQDADSRVEQAPSMSVLSDAEATIFVGQTVRWADVSVASTQSGTTTSSVKEAPNSPIQV